MLPRTFHLTFHGLGEPPSGVPACERAYWLPAAVLERAIEAADGSERRDGIDIRFTFDDGNETDHRVALGRLARAGRTATFFVVADRINRSGYLCGTALRELIAAGMEIGSHGAGHRNLRALSDAELRLETAGAKARIEDATGIPVTRFSVPFGLYDRRVITAAFGAGFRCVYTSSGGFSTADAGLIPRTTVKAGFDPDAQLPGMVRLASRVQSAILDRGRRIKHCV